MNTYVVDFETYWDASKYTLSKMGPIEYIRDERFKPQLLAAFTLEGQGVVSDNADDMREFFRRRNSDAFIGHNIAGFDALILSEYFGAKPEHIYDTIGMMNWVGYSRIIPRSHAALTELLGNGTKRAGTVVSSGKQWPQDFTPEEQKFFIEYCRDDANQCRLNAARMLPFMTPDALLFMDITARMATHPVFELDEKLLEEYIAEIDAKVEQARKDLLSIFHFANEGAFLAAIRSSAKFAVMLTSLGVEPPMKESEAKTRTKKAQLEMLYDQATTDAERVTIRQRMETELPVMTYAFSKTDLPFLALREHPDMRVQMLVNARLDHNTSIDRSRAERLLFFARQHKPVPIMLSAWNAHTGRYTAGAAEEGGSSDRLQFQNLSKRDPSKAKLRQAIHAPAGYKVVACDSGQVEARCLAWAANETGLVAQFREGRDPYSELAETVFQVPHEEIFYGAKHGDKRMKMYRNVGKTAILSCLAGTVEVLTNTGWKRIDTVSINDKVWDGESWVNHEGLICNGWRNTINVAGIDMTPDHLLFDGSSWRTAAELLREPRYLKSATEWANASYTTAPLIQRKDTIQYGFLPHVPTAALNVGTKATHWLMERLASCARIARRETLNILQAIGGVLKTPKLVRYSENLLFLTTTGTNTQRLAERNVQTTGHWFNVPVVLNPIGFCNPICVAEEQHDATLAPRKRRGQRKTRTIGAMQILSLMQLREGVCLAGFPHASQGAVLPKINARLGNTMAAEESAWNFQTASPFLSILSRCQDMMTHLWSWTASTAMATMHQVIFALFLGQRICSTSAMSLTCKVESTSSKETKLLSSGASEPCSTNYQKVYDLKNCGPNNRFLIRQGTTMLMAHNCGYGVGSQKFSDTLARQGARLSDDPDKHREMAFNAHAIYRAAHPNIVKFWTLCGNVIKDMEAGYSGEFGGPDGKLFKFGTKEMGDCGRQVPYILLPNGYHLWYPNLRVENDNGKVQYFYDRPRGKNVIKTKIYGGSATENCIARGSLILTDSGWKPIETITLNDKVYDGVDFVTHSGVVSRGVQDCIQVDGIWMTPDHKLLTEDGWQYAKETDVRRLRRCSLRGTLGEGSYSSQLQGYNWATLWASRCREALVFCQRQMALAFSLRLRRGSRTQDGRCIERTEARQCPSMQCLCSKGVWEPVTHARHVERPALCGVALHETPVLLSNVSCVSKIWSAWDNCMRQVEGFVRKLLGRYGAYISTWLGVGQDRQRWELLPGELSLDNIQGELPKQEGSLQRDRCGHSEPYIWHRENNDILSHQSRVALGEIARQTRLQECTQGSARQYGEARTQEEVYDILNCGRRQSFVVKGIGGPVIAHNCIQSLAFMVLAWQACRMHEAGIQLAANIHDSFATVVPEEQAEETAKRMEHYMSMCPEWASTLPIACESEIGDSFLVV